VNGAKKGCDNYYSITFFQPPLPDGAAGGRPLPVGSSKAS
jgi:hypothetical protein